MNVFDTIKHAAGAGLVVLQDGAPLATGKVGQDEHFEVELPEGTAGEIEIRLGLHDAATVTAQANGDDIMVRILYNTAANR